jgi:type I restriction enzyme S subunit
MENNNIKNLSTYDNYKPSDIEWIGDIPKKWKLKRLKKLTTFRRGSFPQPYNDSKWYNDINGNPFVQVADVNDNYKLKEKTKQSISKLAEEFSVFVPKNSLIMTIQGTIGKLAITQYNSFVDRTLLIFKSFSTNIQKKYLIYILELLFEEEKQKAIGGTILTINKEKLSEFLIIYPNKKEQKAISLFLDKKTELIDKKLEILKERKKLILELEKSVINQVVTKGLQSFDLDMNGEKIDFNNDNGLSERDFDTYMNECGYKDSGIEWIGYINKDFAIKRGNNIFEYEKIKNIGMINNNNLSLTYKGVINRDINNNSGLKPKDYATYQIVEKDDLIFKLIDLENRKTSRVGIVHEKGIMSSAYIKLKNKNRNKYNSFYFYQQYYDLYLRGVYNELGGAGVRSTLTFGDLLNIKIVVPKTKKNQEKILEFLNKKTSQFKSQVSNIDKEIELLGEFRKTIINDVVTGKIKVIK